MCVFEKVSMIYDFFLGRGYGWREDGLGTALERLLSFSFQAVLWYPCIQFCTIRETLGLGNIIMQHFGCIRGEKQDVRELDPACVITRHSPILVSRGPR